MLPSGTMTRVEPEGRQRGQDLLEPLALLAERRVLRLVRGGKVGIHGVNREVLTLCNLGQRRARLSWRKPRRFMPVSIFRWQRSFERT